MEQEQTQYLWFTYEEWEEGGEICEGEENASWPNYEPTYMTFTPVAICRQQPQTFNIERIEATPQMLQATELHVLVVRYNTGNTFGRNNGRWELLGTFLTVQEAEAYQEMVSAKDYKGYCCWKGHFEELVGFEIHTMPVVCKIPDNSKTKYFRH